MFNRDRSLTTCALLVFALWLPCSPAFGISLEKIRARAPAELALELLPETRECTGEPAGEHKSQEILGEFVQWLDDQDESGKKCIRLIENADTRPLTRLDAAAFLAAQWHSKPTPPKFEGPHSPDQAAKDGPCPAFYCDDQRVPVSQANALAEFKVATLAYVQTDCPGPPFRTYRGSGVMVRAYAVLTAAHVIQPGCTTKVFPGAFTLDQSPNSLVARFGIYEAIQQFQGPHNGQNAQYDYGVLLLDRPIPPWAPIAPMLFEGLPPVDPPGFRSIELISYPTFLFSNTGVPREVKTPVVNQLQVLTPVVSNEIKVGSNYISGGSSGGPLFKNPGVLGWDPSPVIGIQSSVWHECASQDPICTDNVSPIGFAASLGPHNEAQINFWVRLGGVASVFITSPANNQTSPIGSTVHFEASASIEPSGLDDKTRSGTSTPVVKWYSDRQGLLGEGPTLDRADLIGGAHRIEARVDQPGANGLPLFGRDSIALNINGPHGNLDILDHCMEDLETGSCRARFAYSTVGPYLSETPFVRWVEKSTTLAVGHGHPAVDLVQTPPLTSATLELVSGGTSQVVLDRENVVVIVPAGSFATPSTVCERRPSAADTQALACSITVTWDQTRYPDGVPHSGESTVFARSPGGAWQRIVRQTSGQHTFSVPASGLEVVLKQYDRTTSGNLAEINLQSVRFADAAEWNSTALGATVVDLTQNGVVDFPRLNHHEAGDLDFFELPGGAGQYVVTLGKLGASAGPRFTLYGFTEVIPQQGPEYRQLSAPLASGSVPPGATSTAQTLTVSGSAGGTTFHGYVLQVDHTAGQGCARPTASFLSCGEFDYSLRIETAAAAAQPDAFEADDTRETARGYDTTQPPQIHSFHQSSDVDWVALWLPQGYRADYALRALDTTAAASWRVEMWSVDPATYGLIYVTSRDFGGAGSSLGIEGLAGRMVWLKVSPISPTNMGASSRYSVALTVSASQNSQDAYEPNDTRESATTGAPATQTHNFHSTGDEDWIAMWIGAGLRSQVQVQPTSTTLSSGWSAELYTVDTSTGGLVFDQKSEVGAPGVTFLVDARGGRAAWLRMRRSAAAPASLVGTASEYRVVISTVAEPSFAQDPYEPDDTRETFRAVDGSQGWQYYNFHAAHDEDWVGAWIGGGATLNIDVNANNSLAADNWILDVYSVRLSDYTLEFVGSYPFGPTTRRISVPGQAGRMGWTKVRSLYPGLTGPQTGYSIRYSLQ